MKTLRFTVTGKDVHEIEEKAIAVVSRFMGWSPEAARTQSDRLHINAVPAGGQARVDAVGEDPEVLLPGSWEATIDWYWV